VTGKESNSLNSIGRRSPPIEKKLEAMQDDLVRLGDENIYENMLSRNIYQDNAPLLNRRSSERELRHLAASECFTGNATANATIAAPDSEYYQDFSNQLSIKAKHLLKAADMPDEKPQVSFREKVATFKRKSPRSSFNAKEGALQSNLNRPLLGYDKLVKLTKRNGKACFVKLSDDRIGSDRIV